MANKRITDFDPVVSLASTDVLHAKPNSGGQDVKITYDDLSTQILSNYTPPVANTTTQGVIEIADSSESQAGVSTSLAMTPSGTKDYVDSRLASQAQAEAGTNNTEVMTPLRTEQNFNENFSARITLVGDVLKIDLDNDGSGDT